MKAGAKEAIPFTEGAIDAIAAWSHGIPRLINAICDNALLISFSESTRTVEMRHIPESDGSNVPSASVTVNMAGCTAGQFVYGAVGPINLPAGGSYYLVSQETIGGDQWYDSGTVSTTTAAVVNSSAYFYLGAWNLYGSASTSFVPVNFQY